MAEIDMLNRNASAALNAVERNYMTAKFEHVNQSPDRLRRGPIPDILNYFTLVVRWLDKISKTIYVEYSFVDEIRNMNKIHKEFHEIYS